MTNSVEKTMEAIQGVKQMQLMEKYRKILAGDIWAKDSSMVEYSIKKTAHIVALEDGCIIPIDKPSIEKDFCFGYDLNNHDTDSYDQANRMVDHAQESADYFISRNLRDINEIIEDLDGTGTRNRKYYKLAKSYNQPTGCKLRQWTSYPSYMDASPMNEPMTADDMARLADGYRIVRNNFIKRLNTYLKRYGTSKVNSWSYWRDA